MEITTPLLHSDPRRDDEDNLLGREGKLDDGLSKVHDFLGIGVNSDSASHGTWRAVLAASALMRTFSTANTKTIALDTKS